MRIDYVITPRARISAGRTGQVQNSRRIHDVIPGNVVRGALGTAWWLDRSDDQVAFDDLFTRSMVVGGAIPSQGSEVAAFEPLSWAACKYPSEDDGCDGDFHDQAVLALAALRAGRRLDEEPWLLACPSCERPVELSKSAWKSNPAWTVATTRTALKDAVAANEQLYTRRAIVQDVVLRGHLRLRHEPDEPTLTWLLQERVIRLGGQRSTMGLADWSATLAEESQPPSTSSCMVILRSPAILVDEFGAPSLDLALAVRRMLQRSNAPGQVLRTWTRPEVVTGWHGIAGVPKPSEWAIAAGSVALVDETSAVSEALLRSGIGLRQLEGYGEVIVEAITKDTPSVHPRSGKAPARATKPNTPVARLIAALPEHLRERTLRALQDEVRMMIRLRSYPERISRERVAGLGSKPWMSDLVGGSRDIVTEILLSQELEQHLVTLETVIGNGGKP